SSPIRYTKETEYGLSTVLRPANPPGSNSRFLERGSPRLSPCQERDRSTESADRTTGTPRLPPKTNRLRSQPPTHHRPTASLAARPTKKTSHLSRTSRGC